MNLIDLRKENEVLNIFCELAQIPSPSLKEEKVAEWIIDFCKKNNINVSIVIFTYIYIIFFTKIYNPFCNFFFF